MPPKNKEEVVPDTSLLAQLDKTSPSSLKDGVAKVEGFSKNDEENHGRWLKSLRKRISTKLLSWFLHFLFVVVCGVVLFVVSGTVWLTYNWVSSFADDPDKVGAFLGKIWDIALLALATLFIQNIWPKE